MRVPRYLIGVWQRHSIVMSENLKVDAASIDATSRVIYLQTASRYADIRFSFDHKSLSHRSSLAECSWDELKMLGNVLADFGVCEVSLSRSENDGLVAPAERFRKRFVGLDVNYCFATEKTLQSKKNLIRHMQQKSKGPFKHYLNSIGNPTDWIGDETLDVAEWHANINFQPVTTYPEPGLLRLSQNKLFEIAPSRAYIEDWRLLKGSATAESKENIHSFRLLKERKKDDGNWVDNEQGHLLISNDHAILVRDKRKNIQEKFSKPLHEVLDILCNENDRQTAETLLSCEFTYYIRNQRNNSVMEETYNVLDYTAVLSTLPFANVGTPIGSTLDLHTWEVMEEKTKNKERIYIQRLANIERMWVEEKNVSLY